MPYGVLIANEWKGRPGTPSMGYPLVNALTERSTLGHCSAASRGWWERGGHPEMKTLLSARPNTAVSRSCRFAPVTGPQKAEIAIIGAQSPRSHL